VSCDLLINRYATTTPATAHPAGLRNPQTREGAGSCVRWSGAELDALKVTAPGSPGGKFGTDTPRFNRAERAAPVASPIVATTEALNRTGSDGDSGYWIDQCLVGRKLQAPLFFDATVGRRPRRPVATGIAAIPAVR